MGKLSILGERRVKALLEMLADEEAKELLLARAAVPSEDDIRRNLENGSGVDLIRAELDKVKFMANELCERINSVTGEGVYLRVSTDRYNHGDQQLHAEWEQAILDEYNKHTKILDDIKSDYKVKRSRLWLCETLEEAKAIVGIE